MEEHSQWKLVYYEGLSSRNLPLGTMLLVMIAHYVGCVNGGRGTVATPFHFFRNTTSIPHNATPTPPVSEHWRVVSLTQDPLSFMYNSFLLLTGDVDESSKACHTSEEAEEEEEADDHSGMIQVCVMHAISLGSFIAL